MPTRLCESKVAFSQTEATASGMLGVGDAEVDAAEVEDEHNTKGREMRVVTKEMMIDRMMSVLPPAEEMK